jgi:hypothetical protein
LSSISPCGSADHGAGRDGPHPRLGDGQIPGRSEGSIKPGYLADLAVPQDIFTIPLPAVPGTVSVFTLVGGEIVWDAGVLP